MNQVLLLAAAIIVIVTLSMAAINVSSIALAQNMSGGTRESKAASRTEYDS